MVGVGGLPLINDLFLQLSSNVLSLLAHAHFKAEWIYLVTAPLVVHLRKALRLSKYIEAVTRFLLHYGKDMQMLCMHV